jgi:Na+/proline symporter
MSAYIFLACILLYFAGLYLVAWYTSKGATEHSFFVGGRQSNWLVVAYGMIGTSLSGVTFMSVPGQVEAKHFVYFGIVIGYFIGYFAVAFVLLPLYYRLQLTSIYHYLYQRFGVVTYKTGSLFFIVSRTMGATIRMYLVINVLQLFILDAWHVPFIVTTCIILVMIWLYTFKGGVKTIVWTDMLQTTFMLLALAVCVVYIKSSLSIGFGEMWNQFSVKNYNQIWNVDYHAPTFYLKQILGGAFVTIAMTGLDQEMMQKNISCKTLGDAQKNMVSFSFILLLVNFVFLILGGLMYLYVDANHLIKPTSSDDLFPTIALNYLPPVVSLLFLIGLISALFPSADGAITALTTSVCVDVLGIDKNEKKTEAEKKKIRQQVQLCIIAAFLGCIMFFKILNQKAIIDLLLMIASYTYGPLLGLYAFGLLSTRKINDKLSWVICIAAPLLCYTLTLLNTEYDILNGYKLGMELLIINGLLTYGGLWLISKKDQTATGI